MQFLRYHQIRCGLCRGGLLTFLALIVMNDKQHKTEKKPHKTTERSVISCSHCGFSPYKTPVQGSVS